MATLKAFRRALRPGAGSEAFQTSMLNHLKSILDNIETSRTNKVDLYAWVKYIVTQATMRAIYDNPLRSKPLKTHSGDTKGMQPHCR